MVYVDGGVTASAFAAWDFRLCIAYSIPERTTEQMVCRASASQMTGPGIVIPKRLSQASTLSQVDSEGSCDANAHVVAAQDPSLI